MRTLSTSSKLELKTTPFFLKSVKKANKIPQSDRKLMYLITTQSHKTHPLLLNCIKGAHTLQRALIENELAVIAASHAPFSCDIEASQQAQRHHLSVCREPYRIELLVAGCYWYDEGVQSVNWAGRLCACLFDILFG